MGVPRSDRASSVGGEAKARTRDEVAINALMESFLDGDGRAFEGLFRATAPRVTAFLASLCGSSALAEDLTQQTYLKVYRARATFHRGAAVLPWIFSIARRTFIDHKRSTKNTAVSLTADGTLPEPPNTLDDDADDLRRLSIEQTQTLYARIETLSPVQREAIVLLKVRGLSIKEAAAVAGVTVPTLKVRAHRAYEALRAALGVSKKEGP